jgi:hypothetical protein
LHERPLDEVLKETQANYTLEFKPLPEVMASLGHKHVDLMKIDIDAGEFLMIPAMLRGDWGTLPPQLALEMHYRGTYGKQRRAARPLATV